MEISEKPTDLFDAICRLDDCADFLADQYPEETDQIREASASLKQYVEISIQVREDS